MNRHRVVHTFFRNLTSGLLSYSLVLLLCAPFSVAGRAGSSLLPMLQPGSAVQVTARREGELLVKFRSGASQRDRAASLREKLRRSDASEPTEPRS